MLKGNEIMQIKSHQHVLGYFLNGRPSFTYSCNARALFDCTIRR